MARFSPDTFSTFLKRMAYRLVARSELTDLETGGELFTLLSAVARELDGVSFQTSNLQKLWDLDTAAADDLDARAVDFYPGTLERWLALKATGTVVFSRSGTAGTATIPAGHSVKVPNGAEFVTTAVGTITPGNTDSAAVGIEAVVGDRAGNVDAGAITIMGALAGVDSVVNGTPTTGGQPRESDDQFRRRIRDHLRGLPRGTVDALRGAALTAALDGIGRVTSVEVVEDATTLGRVYVYIDNGSGTVLQTATLAAPEVVVASAAGGEVRLFTDNKPVVEGETFTLEVNGVPVVENTDYTLNRATGQITLDPTLYPSGLTTADAVTATAYTWYTGLVQEVQKIIDGDPADRTSYPGYRAAGTHVVVRAPTVLSILIAANVVLEDGFDSATVLANVQNALLAYVNGLGINGDVIFNELVHRAMAVAGVRDVTFTAPLGDVVVGDSEIIRVTASDVDLTAA